MRLHVVARLVGAGVLLLTACGGANAGQTGGPPADPSAQQVTITGTVWR